MNEAIIATAAFGLALAFTAGTAGRSPTKGLSTLATGALGVGWALAVITSPIAATNHEVMLSWAALDLVFGVSAAVIYYFKRHAWLIVLAFLYFGQCFLHVQYWTGHIPEPSLLNYQRWVNVVLAAQIACVATPGAWHVARDLLDAVFPGPRRRAGDRAQRGRGA